MSSLWASLRYLHCCVQVCQEAGVPLEVVPLTEQYWQQVVSHCLDEIRAGRTPNPDILCNSRSTALCRQCTPVVALCGLNGLFVAICTCKGNHALVKAFFAPCRVKFGAFYEHLASNFSQAFDRIGSGHYARLVRDPGGDCGSQVRLAMTPDAVKDQTYFLAHLSQQQLARTIFPLGTLTKVRWNPAADRSMTQ